VEKQGTRTTTFEKKNKVNNKLICKYHASGIAKNR
jgi:hypothetical protein